MHMLYIDTLCTHRPLSHFCSFCDVTYDVVGTMEEFDNDIDYIAKKMNITELLNQKGRRENYTSRSGDLNIKTTERILSYFTLLEKHDKLRLYNLYKIDFEMFGYSATRYL